MGNKVRAQGQLQEQISASHCPGQAICIPAAGNLKPTGNCDFDRKACRKGQGNFKSPSLMS